MAQITVLKSKLHFIHVTDVSPDYEGSMGIDASLMELANIRPYEQIHVFNCNNGSRLITYAIPAPAGSKKIQINGAAAHHAKVGDKVIIVAFQAIDPEETPTFETHKLIFNPQNEVVQNIREKHV